MDGQYLPWWSILLLGMWAVAVTLWIHPKVDRELRLWAGLACLVYIVLIFLALTASPAPDPGNLGGSLKIGMVEILSGLLIAISLTACLWSLSPISHECRQACYTAFTLANAGLCLLFGQWELSVGLLIVVGIIARPLLRTYLKSKEVRSVRAWLFPFIQFRHGPADEQPEFWRIGALTCLLTVTLVGTISYATSVENIQPAGETQQSVLPSASLLNRILTKKSHPAPTSSLVDLALSTRADLVVLMAIILFLKLGMSMPGHAIEPPAPAPATLNEPQSEEP